MSIAPEIKILFLMAPWFYPAILAKKERLTVIQQGKSIFSDNPSFQRDFSVCLVQCSGCPLQVLKVLSIMPDTSIGAEISHSKPWLK